MTISDTSIYILDIATYLIGAITVATVIMILYYFMFIRTIKKSKKKHKAIAISIGAALGIGLLCAIFFLIKFWMKEEIKTIEAVPVKTELTVKKYPQRVVPKSPPAEVVDDGCISKTYYTYNGKNICITRENRMCAEPTTILSCEGNDPACPSLCR